MFTKVRFELLMYLSKFQGHYDGNLPPPRNSPRELLIFHQNSFETMAMPHEVGKLKDLKEWTKDDLFKGRCCPRKHTLSCKQQLGVNFTLIFKKENVTIHGFNFTYKKNVSPFAYVYVTENGEEALIYYNKFGYTYPGSKYIGSIRGSFELNDGRSFAFHKCVLLTKVKKQEKRGRFISTFVTKTNQTKPQKIVGLRFR